MSKRAVLYARVSTDDQADKGYSLPSQLELCRKYSEQHGFQVVAEFQEDYSGATAIAERPEGKRLWAMLKSREADAVIAYQVDRLSRDIVDLLATVKALLLSGIEVHATDIGRVTSYNDIVLVIKGWQGTDEREKITERCSRGRNTKARSGRVVGSRCPPYGYRFIRDEKGKVIGLEIYEKEARIVRLIFAWYVRGDESGKPLTLWQIAAKLTQMAVPTPSESHGYRTVRKLTVRKGIWSDGSLASNIIGNETYAGIWRYGTRVGEGGKDGRRALSEQIAVSVPAIVDRDLWTAAQERRRVNAKMSQRNGKQVYLLRSMVKCSCGRTMSGQASGSKRIRYYRCVGNGYFRSNCTEHRINGDRLEAHVWERIKARFESAGFESALYRAQQEEANAEEPIRDELAKLEKMIAACDAEAYNCAEAMRKAAGRVKQSLEAQQNEINARYAALTRRRDELTTLLHARRLTDDAIGNLVQFRRDTEDGMRHAADEDKRRIFELLDVNVQARNGEAETINCVIGNCTLQNAIRLRLDVLCRAPRLHNGSWTAHSTA